MEQGALPHEFFHAPVTEEIEVDANERVEFWVEGLADLFEVLVTERTLWQLHFADCWVDGELRLQVTIRWQLDKEVVQFSLK